MYFDEGGISGDYFGMRETYFTAESLGTLRNFLQVYCPLWSLYPRRYGDMCYDQLRTIIREGLGAPAWIEIYAGRSWLQYRSLDVYWSMRSSLSDPPDVVRWVLNSTVPPLERQEIEPAQWLMCMDLSLIHI